MEIWKDIKGYEGLYEVSSLGNIKSLPKKRRGICHNDEMIISKYTPKQGYQTVALSDSSGIAKTLRVHRLVAINFIPNPESKYTVNHINGIKTDNRVENLEWCSTKENNRHSWDIGLSTARRGEDIPAHKLTRAQVDEIRARFQADRITITKLASEYNVNRRTIGGIISGTSWCYGYGHRPRKNHGENCPHRKLNNASVLDIIQSSKDGVSYAELGRKYNVTRNTVWGIVKGKTWKHLTPAENSQK